MGVHQGVRQLLRGSAADSQVMRGLGLSRGQAALTASGPGILAVLAAAAIAVAGAIALLPLAPVGEVRAYGRRRPSPARPGSASAYGSDGHKLRA